MHKVSIIIPFYNVENYISKALESCINQTLNDIEIICVDDCSTDNSLKIVQDYAIKDSRIKIICQKENQGQGVARNLAIKEAKGEYITFLDSDDWLELDACEVMYNAAKDNNANVVQTPFCWHNKTKNKVEIADRFKNFSRMKHIEIMPNSFVDLKTIPQSDFRSFGLGPVARLYSLKHIKENNISFAPYKKAEDHKWTIDLKLSTPIYYINKPTYNRFRRQDSASNSTTLYDEIVESIQAVVKKYPKTKYIKEKYNDYVVWRFLMKYRHGNYKNVFGYLNDIRKYSMDNPFILLYALKELFYYKLNKFSKKYLINIFSVKNKNINDEKYKILMLFGKQIKLKKCS